MSLLLSGPMMKLPASGGGVLFTDDFTGYTSGNALTTENGTDFGVLTGWGSTTVYTSDEVGGTSSAKGNTITASMSLGTDYYIEVTVAAFNTGASRVMRLFMFGTDTSNMWNLEILDTGAVSLVRYSGGSNVQSQSGTSITWSVPNVVRLAYDGGDLVGYFDGVEKVRITPAGGTSSGDLGFSSSKSDVLFEDVTVGNL